ncbi:MAG: hypothetical protein KBF48_13740 [Xanthomonadales bacterium]|nr:hypothetical protein [Xanthomonadales bacterium]
MSDVRELFSASNAETVTPHDTTKLTAVTRALYVGVAGNVAVLMADGSTATFVGVPAGTLLPIRIQRVNTTNTTATTMVGLS